MGPRVRGRRGGDRAALAAAVAVALVLRVVLALRSEAISVDGVQYVEAAQRFASGEWRSGLASFYPPGYPAAVAAAHAVIPDWETAGVVVSLVAGLLALAPLAAIARRAGLGGPAFAATLVGLALAPYPARYAAMVRSEALYALLVLLAVAAVLRSGAGWLLAGGALSGAAYLVRPEGLGLAVPLAAWAARTRSARAAGLVVCAAMLVAAPYVVYLRADTGAWVVSRKAANVVSLGIHAATGRGDVVTQAASDRTGLVDVVRHRSGAYLRKVAIDLWRTVGAFAECLSPLLVPFLLLGLWLGRRGFADVHRLLGATVVFYLVALALLYVDRRFYTALVPLALVWCGAGFGWAWSRAGRAAPALALVVAALLVGKAVHDREGAGYVRRIGTEIARRTEGRPVVAAADLRVAWYAGGRRVDVLFPLDAVRLVPILEGGADWLVVSDGDLTREARTLLEERAGRLELVTTIPTKGTGSATLYRIRHE